MDPLPKLDGLSHAEKDSLLLALWQQVHVLQRTNTRLEARIAELEAQLRRPGKTPRNSSLPPSTARKASTTAPPVAEPSDKTAGDGAGADGTAGDEASATGTEPVRSVRVSSLGRAGGGRPLHPEPDQLVSARLTVCPHCAHTLGEADQRLHGLYDKIDLPPIRPVVTRVSQYQARCPSCSRVSLAPVPLGLELGSPFGPGVVALSTYLRYGHAISYERLSRLLAEVFGVVISEGAISNLLLEANERLEPRVQEALSRLRVSELVASDETSARVSGTNHWEWVFHNESVCVHVVRPSRGAGVIEEVMAGHRPRVWLSDLYSAQAKHPAQQWQVCLAHQLRDCQYAIDAGDEQFAPAMRFLLLRAMAIDKRRADLKASSLQTYRYDLERRLEACLKIETQNVEGQRLKRRYRKVGGHLFVFLTNEGVAATNNGSERALRPSVIFRKVTGGFRSHWGAAMFAAVRTVTNTGQRLGLTAYEAIKRALSPVESFLSLGSLAPTPKLESG